MVMAAAAAVVVLCWAQRAPSRHHMQIRSTSTSDHSPRPGCPQSATAARRTGPNSTRTASLDALRAPPLDTVQVKLLAHWENIHPTTSPEPAALLFISPPSHLAATLDFSLAISLPRPLPPRALHSLPYNRYPLLAPTLRACHPKASPLPPPSTLSKCFASHARCSYPHPLRPYAVLLRRPFSSNPMHWLAIRLTAPCPLPRPGPFAVLSLLSATAA